MSIMEIKRVRYFYDNKRNILKSVNMDFETGKMYVIVGPSGCGKTTLLSLLGGLDSPSDGQVLFQEDIEKKGLAYHRKNNVALTSKLPPLPILERLGLTKEETKELAKQADVILKLRKAELQIVDIPDSNAGIER